MINIIFGGDICPMGKVEKAFIQGRADEIFHDLADDITNADLSVANLECPLVSGANPLVGKDGILAADPKCIKGFVSAKWDLLNLANNHSFDYGAKGLMQTIDTIKTAGLAVIGAGKNIQEAQAPFIRQVKGQRIVIYSMAEREFSVADEEMAGANPLDLINFVNAVHEHKQDGVFIVLLHGGKEYYPYPTPEMVKRCRFMIDMGADAVICCHTHCPLPWEVYKNKPIAYGLGNFIFEPFKKQANSWYKGYIAQLSIKGQQVSLSPIPYWQSREHVGARKMNSPAREYFIIGMRKKAEKLRDLQAIKHKWAQYCKQEEKAYLEILFGYNRIMRKLSPLLSKILHSKKAVLRALLLAQCETHREILNTIFRLRRKSVRFDSRAR